MEQVHGSDDDDSDDDSSEEEDDYDLEDGWEDERGEEEYPDEVSESGDGPLDTSWEDSNEYDFEDPEYLRLPPSLVSGPFSCSPSSPDTGPSRMMR